MNQQTNSLNWFEIPALDITRSKTFFETIFEIQLFESEMGDSKMAFFPFEPGSGKANGSIVESPQHKPSMEGSIVYLNANPNMDNVLSKVEANGGKILVPKMSIGEHGNIAFILDTEGNKVGIHSIE